MSKFALQQQAFDHSGVSYDESQKVLQLSPTIYDRLGHKGIEKLSTLFYDRVFGDREDPNFLNIFASSTKREAIENQVGTVRQHMNCA